MKTVSVAFLLMNCGEGVMMFKHNLLRLLQSGTVDFAYAFAQAKSGSILFAIIDLLQVTDTIKECIDNVR